MFCSSWASPLHSVTRRSQSYQRSHICPIQPCCWKYFMSSSDFLWLLPVPWLCGQVVCRHVTFLFGSIWSCCFCCLLLTVAGHLKTILNKSRDYQDSHVILTGMLSFEITIWSILLFSCTLIGLFSTLANGIIYLLKKSVRFLLRFAQVLHRSEMRRRACEQVWGGRAWELDHLDTDLAGVFITHSLFILFYSKLICVMVISPVSPDFASAFLSSSLFW